MAARRAGFANAAAHNDAINQEYQEKVMAEQGLANTPQIYRALALAAAEIGAVGKDKQNVQQNYKFRGIDAVVNAVHPVFVKHGIVTALKVVEQKREERQTKNGATLLYSLLHCEVTFYAADGSSVTCGALGEGMDSGDKASNKAMSAALKYALTQTLMIPFEVNDSEDSNPEPTSRPAPAPREAVVAKQQKVMEVKAEAQDMDKRINKTPIGGKSEAPRYGFQDKPKGAVLAGWENKAKYWCVIEDMSNGELLGAHETCSNQAAWETDNGKDTKWTDKDLAAIEVELRKRQIEIPSYE